MTAKKPEPEPEEIDPRRIRAALAIFLDGDPSDARIVHSGERSS